MQMIRLRMVSILALCNTLGYTQQIKTTERKGLMFSFSTGVGNSRLAFAGNKQSNTDLALNWKIGYMLNPKLALLINGAVAIYDFNLSGRPRKRDFGGVFPSVQYHLNNKWWVLGGIGLGTDAPVFYDLKPDNQDELKYHSGFGGITAIGYEICKRKNIAVDLQARYNYSKVNLPTGAIQGNNIALLVGINFY